MRVLPSAFLWSRVTRAAFVAAITAIPSLALSQQQQASISGRVMAHGTNEPLADVRRRVAPGLTDLLAELAAAGRPGSIDAPQVSGYRDPVPDQPWTILVGHDGVFKVLLLTLFDLPLERFWMWSSDLCGITVIELRAGRPVIRAMNLTEHLASLLDEEAQTEAEARTRSGAL